LSAYDGKRDTRYVLTRRRSMYSRLDSSFFQRTDAAGFKSLDDHARHIDRHRGIFQREPPWWFIPISIAIMVVAILLPWRLRQTRDELPPNQQALDVAATERAGAFVRALGFAPGPAVCRSVSSGSAWCTIRVAESDKTFSLWCDRRHPTCIEAIYPSD
jgi:hypothetical protein